MSWGRSRLISVGGPRDRVAHFVRDGEHWAEAASILGLEIYPIASLFALAAHLIGVQLHAPKPAQDEFSAEGAAGSVADFAEVRGQERVTRALEAAAGQHGMS